MGKLSPIVLWRDFIINKAKYIGVDVNITIAKLFLNNIWFMMNHMIMAKQRADPARQLGMQLELPWQFPPYIG
jgi:hypothetical protein